MIDIQNLIKDVHTYLSDQPPDKVEELRHEMLRLNQSDMLTFSKVYGYITVFNHISDKDSQYMLTILRNWGSATMEEQLAVITIHGWVTTKPKDEAEDIVK